MEIPRLNSDKIREYASSLVDIKDETKNNEAKKESKLACDVEI